MPQTTEGNEEVEATATSPMSKTQLDRLSKSRRKALVVVEHLDIIQDEFWERRPWLLTNRPGRLLGQVGARYCS